MVWPGTSLSQFGCRLPISPKKFVDKEFVESSSSCKTRDATHKNLEIYFLTSDASREKQGREE